MPGFIRNITPIIAIIILISVLSACTPAPVVENIEVTRLVPQTVVVTQIMEIVLTATSLPPTETPLPTSSPSPEIVFNTTETVQICQINPEGLNAWCFREGVLFPEKYIDANATMPEYADAYGFVSGALEIINIPKSSCTFIYNLDQPLAAGTTMNIHDIGQKKPWLTSQLIQSAADPNTAFVTTTHAFIVNPPGWDFSYDFVLNGPDGSLIRTDRVNIHRWDPGVCWDGVKPYWPSLLCREKQDSHPWDYGYTPPPPEVIEED